MSRGRTSPLTCCDSTADLAGVSGKGDADSCPASIANHKQRFTGHCLLAALSQVRLEDSVLLLLSEL